MYLRVVRARIAEGMTEAYWAWAREILALWDERGVRRAGGPYAAKDEEARDIAVWLTVHDSEEEMRDEFRLLYAEGEGKTLIERRPPLVAETTGSAHAAWDSAGPRPPPPEW